MNFVLDFQESRQCTCDTRQKAKLALLLWRWKCLFPLLFSECQIGLCFDCRIMETWGEWNYNDVRLYTPFPLAEHSALWAKIRGIVKNDFKSCLIHLWQFHDLKKYLGKVHVKSFRTLRKQFPIIPCLSLRAHFAWHVILRFFKKAFKLTSDLLYYTPLSCLFLSLQYSQPSSSILF